MWSNYDTSIKSESYDYNEDSYPQKNYNNQYEQPKSDNYYENYTNYNFYPYTNMLYVNPNLQIDVSIPPPNYCQPLASFQPSSSTPSVDNNQSKQNRIFDENSKDRYQQKRSRSSSRHRSRSSQEKSHSRNYHRNKPTPERRSRSSNRSHRRDLISRNEEIIMKREDLLRIWRKNFCTSIDELNKKLEKWYAETDCAESTIIRSTPAETYYKREITNALLIKATEKDIQLCEQFKKKLCHHDDIHNYLHTGVAKPKKDKRMPLSHCHKKHHQKNETRKKYNKRCKKTMQPCFSSSSSSDSESDTEFNLNDCTMEELLRKQKHPDRLDSEMWHNEQGEMNDGPLCRCSLKAQRSGIRHGIYAGEKSIVPKCDFFTNNYGRLYHYRITIAPPTNFLTKTPTIITHDDRDYIFEGFSLFSHYPLDDSWPTCKVIRFNIDYMIIYVNEPAPENFTVQELELFQHYLFVDILELYDFLLRSPNDIEGCNQFHFMPRFVRQIATGKEVLSMCEVLQYLLTSSKKLMDKSFLSTMVKMSQYDWQNFADQVKGMIVTYPGKKPCSVRVDQLDRNLDEQQTNDEYKYPEIVHFGIRPPQLSYAGNPEYQRAWRDYVKFRHLLANMPKPSPGDKRRLEWKEKQLQDMRSATKLKRDVTVAFSADGFHRTGIMCDIVQHAMLLPVLVCHLRFHHSLNEFEQNIIQYKFKNRYLLQLALTHPSYRENFGTNPDHARNSLTNCGIRQPEYGDRRIHYQNTRKRGINTLINIMSRFGRPFETESLITHNERLEFLGDAVVEFITTIHLYFMFPDLEEGGLATYRAAIVQNQHLALLAEHLRLDHFMLYAHGADLCHNLELKHAMANCFEALMGALFLDGGIDVADKVFGDTLFIDDENLREIWHRKRFHPLQRQCPFGDRHFIEKIPILQKLSEFESKIGVRFKHIRILARAFTDRNVGYTLLTKGSNQRLEFLGDTVLQLISSEYLYKHFPEHHEGHLSLLRSSLVNNRTQAIVCNDLGLTEYARYNNPKKIEWKTKDRADLLEALLGALYVDRGFIHCRTFCEVTLFPRLCDFIRNQEWNDPKSKFQQCCLTLRTMEGGEPDIPIYKVIECRGPTNTRMYSVAVYFRGKRYAKATGHSIQQAEMNAARQALIKSRHLFPQLTHQERIIAKSMKKQTSYGAASQKYEQMSFSNSDSDSEGKHARKIKPNKKCLHKLTEQMSNNGNVKTEDSEDTFENIETMLNDINRSPISSNEMTLMSVIDDDDDFSDISSNDDSCYNLNSSFSSFSDMSEQQFDSDSEMNLPRSYRSGNY